MKTLTVTEVARNFSAIMDGVERDQEEVVLMRNQKAIARFENWLKDRGVLTPRVDAAANAGRSALLVAALTQLPTEPATLLAATRDWLHQDYRAEAMPETAALIGRLRAAGIPAVVSGAGPSVLAFPGGPEKSDYRHHLDSLGSIVRETGIAWHISSLDVERQGARVLLPEPLSG